MKNSISKVALLLLCSVFVLSSCKNDDSTGKGDDPKDKKTVTLQYRILVNSAREYVGTTGGGIAQLYDYTEAEMAKVSTTYDTESWTITEIAATEEAAIAACDKKAIATFDAKLSAMNAAAVSVKDKFNAKKAELQSAIAADKSTNHVKYTGYGAYLFKGAVDATFPNVVVKQGESFDLEAVGGGGK